MATDVGNTAADGSVRIETTIDPTGDVVPVVARADRVRWRSLRSSRKLLVGLGVVGFFVLLALVGPLLVNNPDAVSDNPYAAPSGQFWLGTTNTGQDVFAQLLTGVRGTVLIGFVAGAAATVFSILVGVVGGYLGGPADESLSLVSNVFLVLPGLPLVILVTDYLGSSDVVTVALIIALTSWAGAARVLRAQTLSLRSRDYVDAARVSGEPAWRIIGAEILPNLLPVIASQCVFAVIGAILTQAALAFLGLGGLGSLGAMLYYALSAQALPLGAWWWFVPPGACIALLGAGLALINFSIDEIINPRLRVAAKARSARSKLKAGSRPEVSR